MIHKFNIVFRIDCNINIMRLATTPCYRRSIGLSFFFRREPHFRSGSTLSLFRLATLHRQVHNSKHIYQHALRSYIYCSASRAKNDYECSYSITRVVTVSER